MSRIDICYTACHIATQTVVPALPGFQIIKQCIQYLDSHPYKTLLYTSNSYYGSNFVRLPWIRNQV